MSYFVALVSRTGRGWRGKPVDVDDCADLAEVTERMRLTDGASMTALLVLEHEDEWWGLVRVDGDDDPRVFVSDGPAAAASPYADALELDADEIEPGPAGDVDIVSDLGTPEERLLELSGDDGPLPLEATSAIAEAGGFAEPLDALR